MLKEHKLGPRKKIGEKIQNSLFPRIDAYIPK
jgi:hypothetical protein